MTSTVVEGYFTIPLSHVETSTVVAFDIYLLRRDGGPVLYRERNLIFTEESRRKLEDNGVVDLLVPQAQFGEYRSYRQSVAPPDAAGGAVPVPVAQEVSREERALGEMLQDRTILVDSRAAFLLSVQQQLVEVALSDLGSPGLPQRVFRVAESSARFLMEEPAAYTRLVLMLQPDFEAYTHAINSSLYATQLAIATGMDDPHDIGLIGRAALLHDVGKGDIPGDLLHRSTGLSDLEWAEVMSHVDRGVARLREAGWDDPTCLDVAANHHERADGSGYPRGLQLARISLASRIVAIVDTFDALTSSLPSKPPLSGFQALWTMKRDMQGHFDPALLDQFVALMVERKEHRI
ncbi:MAG: HD domain-containing protein [Acidobacteriota bacterium]